MCSNLLKEKVFYDLLTSSTCTNTQVNAFLAWPVPFAPGFTSEWGNLSWTPGKVWLQVPSDTYCLLARARRAQCETRYHGSAVWFWLMQRVFMLWFFTVCLWMHHLKCQDIFGTYALPLSLIPMQKNMSFLFYCLNLFEPRSMVPPTRGQYSKTMAMFNNSCRWNRQDVAEWSTFVQVWSFLEATSWLAV